MSTRPHFDELKQGALGDALGRIANLRAWAKDKSEWRLVIIAFLLLPWAGWMLANPVGSLGAKIAMIGIFGSIGGYWVYRPRTAAKDLGKEQINSALAQALGFEYQQDARPSEGFMKAKEFQLLPKYRRHTFQDRWTGEINGSCFTLHEALLEVEIPTGKGTHYLPVFQGAVISISCDRSFNGTTMVERALNLRTPSILAQRDALSISGIDFRAVNTVHPKLRDRFAIYASDTIEACELLHPAFIERLIALETAFVGKQIRALFHQWQIVIVVETENMFETGGMDEERDRTRIELCLHQLTSLTELAATLNEPARGDPRRPTAKGSNPWHIAAGASDRY